ncbi:hypothetical protein [Halostagnicola kamekurae]|uniref:DUF7984 domain-containing protein n=1 Tax=Halostagnicola kamekurae TaxID=619731 RepID=A0A1I6QAP7_9EURY|nr:hypothetical protein [Halostagnicola kamekurae]SFS49541.1 hypothetical protein SAMN04488556_1130 [Halostagnicola kamekurae]
MRLTPAAVVEQRDWIATRSPSVVATINDVRAALGEQFETDVDPVTETQYRAEVDAVFADGDLAVNVAALVAILRELDVADDYPGFVVDEILGRELAATIAGTQPLRTLGEATFHYADVHVHGSSEDNAGVDDLEAALAAGFQTRLPGWDWTERDSPFAIDSE